MAAATRSVRMASRLTSFSRPSALFAQKASVTQRAAFSVSIRNLKSEVVKETEVPVSVYSPDAKGVSSANTGDHFSIPVKARQPIQESEPDELVKPLEEKVYRQMPRTLQKMSVMGKVIIITG